MQRLTHSARADVRKGRRSWVMAITAVALTGTGRRGADSSQATEHAVAQNQAPALYPRFAQVVNRNIPRVRRIAAQICRYPDITEQEFTNVASVVEVARCRCFGHTYAVRAVRRGNANGWDARNQLLGSLNHRSTTDPPYRRGRRYLPQLDGRTTAPYRGHAMRRENGGILHTPGRALIGLSNGPREKRIFHSASHDETDGRLMAKDARVIPYVRIRDGTASRTLQP